MVLLEVNNDSYYQIVVLCFECLCSFMNFIIFSRLFYQLYGKDCLSFLGIIKSFNDIENEKLTVTTTKLFSTISVLFYLITTIFLSIHHWTSFHPLYHSSILISDISWTIGQLSCYLLWITRLYWTFQGSVHQSSKLLFNSLGCLAVLFAISMGSAQILLYLHSNSHIHGQHHLPYFYYVITSIFVCIIDLILSSIVMYTFLSKLHDLTAHCQRHWVGDANDYKKDRTTAKFAKAESEHFHQEKQQFRRKAKKKIRKAKKKGIVVVCTHYIIAMSIHSECLILFSCFSSFVHIFDNLYTIQKHMDSP